MKFITHLLIIAAIATISISRAEAQNCGAVQNLTGGQQSQIGAIQVAIDTALHHQDLYHIDSLSEVLKSVYSNQGGLPDASETYYTLVSNTNWLSLQNSILLERALIAADSSVYANLWRTAKGLNPPLYQPHSIFLRTSAETAAGLLKIASRESDLVRKALYENWATSALDSLATMQLPNGAFPFPDLRTYGDPFFTTIIQNFLNSCGTDSVNVLQNGWITDDKGSGEFKFDAGVIANTYADAYTYTGNLNYKNIAISIADYLKPLKFNVNYNYNTFVSLGVTRAFEFTADSSYLTTAINNIRYAAYPGQLLNGRWVDGHNANSRYHNLIIQNITNTIQHLPLNNIFATTIDSMMYRAVKNLVDYSYTCSSATGYRWLIKAYTLNASVINTTLKDSITALLGQYVNQSAINGKYLDVPTIGEYMELLDVLLDVKKNIFSQETQMQVNPNPTSNVTNINLQLPAADVLTLSLYNTSGVLLKTIDLRQKPKGMYNYQLDLTELKNGLYLILLRTTEGTITRKIIKTE